MAHEPLRSVVIAIDVTAWERVIDRVATLPLASKAQLVLLHVVPEQLFERSRQRAARDARAILGEATARLVGRRPDVRASMSVLAGRPAAAISSQASAHDADLIVVGRGSGRTVRDAILGSTAERVVRHANRPVLVVKGPVRGAYKRPVLALDVDEAARRVLRATMRLVPPPRPRVDVVHVYDVPFGGLAYPSLSSEQTEHRRYYEDKARRELERILVEASKDLAALELELSAPRLRYGAARTLVPATVATLRADLVAMGTRGRTGLGYAFLGTVAGDVLREVPCDVLVVPPGRSGRG